MEFIVVTMLFVLGACVGSFVNVLIDRLPRGESIIMERSHCEGCKKTLSPKELVPLLSYLFLKGKCSKCKSKIPLRLFLVELLMAASFAFIGLGFLTSVFTPLTAVFLLVAFPVFVAIFFADLHFGIIPDQLVIVLLVASFLFVYLSTPTLIIPHLIAAFVVFLFFLTLFLITYGRGMGFGDVKLSFVLGLLLGFPQVILALYIAFLSGAAISVLLVVFKKKKLKGGSIPFGPFLIIGAIIAFFVESRLLLLFLGI